MDSKTHLEMDLPLPFPPTHVHHLRPHHPGRGEGEGEGEGARPDETQEIKEWAAAAAGTKNWMNLDPTLKEGEEEHLGGGFNHMTLNYFASPLKGGHV